MTNPDTENLPLWVETSTKDNKVYYYNSVTKETTWKRPQNAKILKYEQLVQQKLAAVAAANSNNVSQSIPTTTNLATTNVVNHAVPTNYLDNKHNESLASRPVAGNPINNVSKPTYGQPLNIRPATTKPNTITVILKHSDDKSNDASGVQSNASREEIEPQSKEKVSQDESQASGNENKTSQQETATRSTKAVSATPISGTPWCVVWTDKGKVFFFNPSTKKSVWERPIELQNRADVDKLISEPAENQSSNETSAADAEKSNVGVSQQNKSGKRSAPSDDEASSEMSSALKQQSSPIENHNQSPQPDTTKPAKVAKKDAPTSIELEAAKKRETIPYEERVDTFRKMLEENQVDPASTFKQELSKIVFDSRYLLLNHVERKEVFEKFCLEKTEEERRKRRQKIKEATDNFRALLTEAKLTPRSYFKDAEFHKQWSKDARYEALSERDRELLFDDHIAYLRRFERRTKEAATTSEKVPQKKSSEKPASLSREDAEDTYNSLLIEHITDTSLLWHDAKRILRHAPQYELLDELSSDWKREAFEKHCERLYKRRKEKFIQLLKETKEIIIGSDWRDVKRIIREDPRYIKFSTSDKKCQRIFKDFMKEKIDNAKRDFQTLLEETKLIDSNTRKTIQESNHQHLINIIGTLQSDHRYTDLDSLSEERRKILLKYIEKLANSNSNNNNNNNNNNNAGNKDAEDSEQAQESQTQKTATSSPPEDASS